MQPWAKLKPTSFAAQLFKLALLMTLAPLCTPTLALAETCFTDWSAARTIIAEKKLRTLDELTKTAPLELGGEIVRSTFCQSETGYVYKLVIRTKDGQIKSLNVEAKRVLPR